MARYGIPYQGSKSRIATWVVDQLPASHTLVDIFAGGCAVTHAALLSGKWDDIIANDLTDGPQIFLRAIHGEFADYDYVPTREEFKASDDSVVRILYSFANNMHGYLWNKELEPVLVAASQMLSLSSLHDRRMAYKRFLRELAPYLEGGDVTRKIFFGKSAYISRNHVLMELSGLERLERLQELEQLQGLQGVQGLQVLQCDYRDVIVPDGATVYADPPYAGASTDAYAPFDHDGFEAWLAAVPFPVYVSEYTPPRGCVVVAQRERTCKMSHAVSTKTTELLCVQERFAHQL